MTPELIATLKSLAEKATPGPWCGYSEPDVGLPYGLFAGIVGQSGFMQMEPLIPIDIDLIVTLRNALPSIIAMAEENERLREALAAIESGDYPRPIGTPWDAERPSKHDRCVHGVWMYETCEGCLDAFVRAALEGTGSC